MDTRYDAIVIGTGQAGPSLAVKLAKSGRKTAIVERKLFGGTCANVGCIPTKTLIASARAAWMARRAAEYGVLIDGAVRVDMQQVKARKDAVVKESNEGVANWLRGTPNLTVIEGHARFIGPYTLAIDGSQTQLHASEIFINTGGRALVPDIPGLDQVDYLTNSSMMEIDFLPPHLLIIGGSYIGLEFAQMYRRFGSQVTVLENGPRIVSREDPEVSAAVQAILEKEGITILCNAKKLQAAKNGADVVLSYGEEGQRGQVAGSHLLLAVGRTPNTQDLGLDKAGILTDARGYITVDEQLHTNVTGIWAMGDVNGRGAFTHTSYNDYEIVAANLFTQEERKISDRITAYALFIDPPLARVGMSEAEARATGRKLLKAKMPMTRVGRARERGETQGFMSVLVDAASKKILGASLLGIESDEAIHGILDVMYAGAPYTTITHAMHIHPTVSELIPTMLEDLKPLE
ncbi:FAD-containing oxidoreductase [Undibacterium sp. TJN25]|uniref:FAD-containing oxidoreductase n=1 Tax=Undibacterium sp. TJN25 TaxID=3413056 RepID=UPI003BF0AFED